VVGSACNLARVGRPSSRPLSRSHIELATNGREGNMIKFQLNRITKTVRVMNLPSVLEAGWLGFTFAKAYPGLVKEGWQLHFYGAGHRPNISTEGCTTSKAAGGASSSLVLEIVKAINTRECSACGQPLPAQPKCCK
jgi:hypothetical protein